MSTIAVSLLVVGVVLLVANLLLYKHLKDRSIGDRVVGVGLGLMVNMVWQSLG